MDMYQKRKIRAEKKKDDSPKSFPSVGINWEKYHMTEAGNVYVKTVKNPIKQMKRQVYLLAHYLEYYGVKVWVEGYAMLLHQNSPVNSGCILRNTRDIDRAVHTPGKVKLTGRKVLEISRLMEQTEKRY